MYHNIYFTYISVSILTVRSDKLCLMSPILLLSSRMFSLSCNFIFCQITSPCQTSKESHFRILNFLLITFLIMHISHTCRLAEMCYEISSVYSFIFSYLKLFLWGTTFSWTAFLLLTSVSLLHVIRWLKELCCENTTQNKCLGEKTTQARTKTQDVNI